MAGKTAVHTEKMFCVFNDVTLSVDNSHLYNFHPKGWYHLNEIQFKLFCLPPSNSSLVTQSKF